MSSCKQCGYIGDAFYESNSNTCKQCIKDRVRLRYEAKSTEIIENKKQREDHERQVYGVTVSSMKEKLKRYGLIAPKSNDEVHKLWSSLPDRKPPQLPKAPKPRLKDTRIKSASFAYRYWLKNMATDEELDEVYEAKPWLDHRLTNAEKSSIRRKLDPEYYAKYRLANIKRKQGKAGKILKTQENIRKGTMNSKNLEKLCGYTVAEYREHLTSTLPEDCDDLFDPSLHVDHIIPLAAFDLENEDHLKVAFDLHNHRMMDGHDNMSKGTKILLEDIPEELKVVCLSLAPEVYERVLD